METPRGSRIVRSTGPDSDAVSMSRCSATDPSLHGVTLVAVTCPADLAWPITCGDCRLDERTCMSILERPQFRDLYDGQRMSKLGDFRKGSLSDGPLTAIGRMLHYSCTLLWQSHEGQIRTMASRQQVLLQEDWIARLSDKVDLVCDRIKYPAFRHSSALEGPGDVDKSFGGLTDILSP